MHIKLFYKTQRELATTLNKIVDAYWNNELNEEIFIQSIQTIYTNNSNKIVKEGDFTKVLKQVCGKRRLEIIYKIIKRK